jgi:hypothetical protein
MEMSGQLHVPAAIPPRIEPPLFIGKGVGWTSGSVWNGVNRKMSCPYRESIMDCSITQHMIPAFVAASYSEVSSGEQLCQWSSFFDVSEADYLHLQGSM